MKTLDEPRGDLQLSELPRWRYSLHVYGGDASDYRDGGDGGDVNDAILMTPAQWELLKLLLLGRPLLVDWSQ